MVAYWSPKPKIKVQILSCLPDSRIRWFKSSHPSHIQGTLSRDRRPLADVMMYPSKRHFGIESSHLRGAGRALKYNGTHCVPYILLSMQWSYGKAQRYVDERERCPSKMQARIGLEDNKSLQQHSAKKIMRRQETLKSSLQQAKLTSMLYGLEVLANISSPAMCRRSGKNTMVFL